jgi:hypothetical protein
MLSVINLVMISKDYSSHSGPNYLYSCIVMLLGFLTLGLPYWLTISQSLYNIFLRNFSHSCFSCAIALFWGQLDNEAELVKHLAWDVWLFMSIGLAGWWILVQLVLNSEFLRVLETASWMLFIIKPSYMCLNSVFEKRVRNCKLKNWYYLLLSTAGMKVAFCLLWVIAKGSWSESLVYYSNLGFTGTMVYFQYAAYSDYTQVVLM